MFVPATPNSRLRKDLQHLDDKFAQLHREPGIRMVEQGGTKLCSILCKPDPWAGGRCGRSDCLPCACAEEGKGGKCMRENILYTLTCQDCKVNSSTLALYTGESSRSGYQRTAEHSKGAKRGDPRNPLVTHGEEYHPDQQRPPAFTVSILRSFTTPLARLIAESVATEACDANIIMNSKGEWGGAGSQD